MTKFDHLFLIIFRAIDLICIVGSAYLAYWIRFSSFNVPDRFRIIIIVGALLTVFFTSYNSAYTSFRVRQAFQLFGKLITAWTMAGCVLLSILVFAHQGEYFSRLWLGYWWVGGLSMVFIARLIVFGFLTFYRKAGRNQRKVILIGDLESCENIARKVELAKWSGFVIEKILLVDDDYRGDLQEIEGLGDEIWLAMPLNQGGDINDILYKLKNHTQNIRLAPNLNDFRLLNHRISQVVGIQMLDISMSPMDGTSGIVKRLEDIFLGILILIFISPLLLIISAFIKLTSPGPVIFKQNRNGIDGRPIKIYKFRSMYVHSEESGKITQAKKIDTRVTPVGRLLRKTSLDELPQFYNVLQGRMSIVGPRPHAIAHNEYYRDLVESYMRRHKVKPGITGWAQVNGLRGETDTLEKMEKRVQHDLYYIDNWSLALDLKIIVMTVFKVLFDKNAY